MKDDDDEDRNIGIKNIKVCYFGIGTGRLRQHEINYR